jgi:hypothetical protein
VVERAVSDLLDAVRGVLAAELSGELSGKTLVDRCTEVAEDLRREYAGEASVPHDVWHYLHDADIRIRDPNYAEAQLALLKSLIGVGR